MTDLAERLAGLTPAKRQLLEQRLRSETRVAEPIAIVGMACRFPGAADLDAFWRLIRDGVDATGEIPSSRWDVDALYDPTGEQPGKMSVRWAGLVDDVDQFDPQFFGISPREAARMDPQQRLLLEVAWEALEVAGLAPERMGGTATGVFVGIGGTDYSKIPAQFEDYYQHIDAHVGTGNALEHRGQSASRTSWTCTARAWRWTRPARRALLGGASGGAKPAEPGMRCGAGGRRESDPRRRRPRLPSPRPGCCRRTATAARSTPAPTATSAARAVGSSC